jgi:hypothetical protein
MEKEKRQKSGVSPPLEARVRKRAKRNALRNALLSTLIVVGALPVALAAPKVLSLIKDEHLDRILPTEPKQRLRETASRLKRKGLIEFRVQDGRKRIYLTHKGREEARRIQVTRVTMRTRKRWDGRWRMIIFDIPEKRKPLRERMREFVRMLGFLKLQDSVWVYPHDCEELVTILKSDLKVGTEVLYIIADAIEHDRPLREHFDLPLSD